MAQEVLNLQLTCELGKVAAAASAMRTRLPPSQWEILAALAAEILREHEASTASTVILVPAAQATRVLTDLGAPTAERALDRALGRG